LVKVEAIRWQNQITLSLGPLQTDMQPSYGYHPCMIWSDWFLEEPEEGSNPSYAEKKKKRQLAKELNRSVDTSTTQL